MGTSYKGYRVGSIEKNILQLLLGVKDNELPENEFFNTCSTVLKTARQKAGFSRTIQQLKSKGLIEYKNSYGELTAKITDKGKNIIEILDNKSSEKNTKTWDGRWRLVIFDIPEKKRLSRNLLRDKLKIYGFIQIQGSVWAYPFPCENIVALIKTYFELGNEVLYLVVESLEGDSRLRKRFKL